MALPKLEGRMRFTVAQSISLNVNATGAGSVPVAATSTDYYHTSTTALLAYIASQANNAAVFPFMPLGYTLTVTLDDTADSATGRVTIAISPADVNFTLDWTTTTLRDYLGFTGNLSGAATYTGTNAARFLFLPDVQPSGLMAPNGEVGMPVSDATFTLSPSGYSKVLKLNTRYVNRCAFHLMRGRKVYDAHETYQNESLQVFWTDVISAGNPFRYHASRAVDGTYVSWRGAGVNEYIPVDHVPNWKGAASLQSWGCDVVHIP
jgi:hypothetical protein